MREDRDGQKGSHKDKEREKTDTDTDRHREGAHHHHLTLNHEGRWGSTDDFTTRFLHFSLFSTALLGLGQLQTYSERELGREKVRDRHRGS